jgi:hypothetical protein
MTSAKAKMRIFAGWRTWVGHRQGLDSQHPSRVRRNSSENLSEGTPTCLHSKAPR